MVVFYIDLDYLLDIFGGGGNAVALNAKNKI